MAPAKFPIYVDEGSRDKDEGQPAKEQQIATKGPVLVVKEQQPNRYKQDILEATQKFYFSERRLYPGGPFGPELSFEELRFKRWLERKSQTDEMRRQEVISKENEELKKELQDMKQKYQLLAQMNEQLKQNQMQFQLFMQQQQQLQQQQQQQQEHQQQQQQQQPQQMPPPSLAVPSVVPNANGNGQGSGRLSILPQCFQQTQTLEFNETSVYGAPTIVRDLWGQTFGYNDKLTYPIDQSAFIRDNIQTSTPTSKKAPDNHENRVSNANRRASRPSLASSPSFKLSPIVETSRDCNSKSSSSSSGMSATPGTTQKTNQITTAVAQPERPIDPADPTSYNRLLACINEPMTRQGCYRFSRKLPKIGLGNLIRAGQDEYMIDHELSAANGLFGAMLVDSHSNESTLNDEPTNQLMKMYCMKIDQPSNEWLFYICKELHRRLVKQRCQPDVELSVMNANPAILYNDGSILIDEYLRPAPLSKFIEACRNLNKQFPKSVAALITLELLQVIKQIHACDIVHMSVNVDNLFLANIPNREDITRINDRTSIIKLVGFDRAMDMRLLPEGSKFECKLEDLIICQMLDSKPWSHEIDWFGALNCIHSMLFGEPLEPTKDTQNDIWAVNHNFKGFPTSVWPSLFKELLNAPKPMIDPFIDELSTWVKANINFVLKEVVILESNLDDYNKTLHD